jgi:acetyltransferase-like isoleucine patch superfamily enzyme
MFFYRLSMFFFTLKYRRLFHSFGNDSVITGALSLRGASYISVGPSSLFGKNIVLSAWSCFNNQTFSPQIIIGENVSIGDYAHITAINEIFIGNNVLFGRWVTVTDNSHGKTDICSLKTPPISRQLYSKGKVVIKDNVWIGDKVTILPNVTIGVGSVIGSNSVVTHDVPDYSVAVGNPARTIKTFNILSDEK